MLQSGPESEHDGIKSCSTNERGVSGVVGVFRELMNEIEEGGELDEGRRD